MYDQHLPGYRKDFEVFPWLKRESDHYVFHFTKGSLAEREIDQITETQEKSFHKIIEFLDIVAPERRISYYLYPDEGAKEKLMGSPWFAQSIYNEYAVHALYTEKHRVIGPHEDTHLLSLPLGLSIGFLQEGLAERMAGHSWFGEPFGDVVRTALLDNQFKVSADLLVQHSAWLDTTDAYAQQYYALAALFADFLIQTYGKERYLKLYAALKRNSTAEQNDQAYIDILEAKPEVLLEKCLHDAR